MRQFIGQIVGNESLKAKLFSDITHNTFSHAYILEGKRGSGKRTIAKYICAALCCEKKNDSASPLPCGSCPACQKILSGISPDVINVVREEGKATMGIDVIRYVRQDVHSVPNDLDTKIYIIEEADKMTDEAQNAFLLTLEEPPAYAGFLLLCEDSQLLLETIRSRAPVLRTEPQSTASIDEYLTRHDARAVKLKSSDPEKYAQLLVSSGEGIGNALMLLEEQNFAPVLARRELVNDFVNAAIMSAPAEKAVSLILRFSQKRDALAEELELIYLALRDIALIKKAEGITLCFYESEQKAAELAERCSLSQIFELIASLERARERVSRNANTRLTLTTLLTESKMLL